MTLTPFTDAAKRSVELARAMYAERQSQDPLQRIRERMSMEVNGAMLLGIGELCDRDCNAGRLAFATSDVLASGLASVAMTITGGDEGAALELVRLLTEKVHDLAAGHVRAAPVMGVVGSAVKVPMAGQA